MLTDTRYFNRHLPTIAFGKYGLGLLYWKRSRGLEWCQEHILGTFKNKHEPIEDEL